MKAKIGDWITIKTKAQCIWDENEPNKKFLIIGFDQVKNTYTILIENGFTIYEKYIKHEQIDPSYVGLQGWYLNPESILGVFTNNSFDNNTNNYIDDDSAGLDLL